MIDTDSKPLSYRLAVVLTAGPGATGAAAVPAREAVYRDIAGTAPTRRPGCATSSASRTTCSRGPHSGPA